MNPWTPEKVAELIAAWGQCSNVTQVAERIGMTYDQTRQKAKRLGLRKFRHQYVAPYRPAEARPEPETYEDCVRFQDAVEMDTYWGLYYGGLREAV
jgi:hypothetical protein